MQIPRSVTGLIATAMATGALVAGLTATSPDVYHDMTHKVATAASAADDGTTAPSPDVYHDM